LIKEKVDKEQPQRGGEGAGSEATPGVRLAVPAHRAVRGTVLTAPHPGGLIAGYPPDGDVVQHGGRRGSAHTVDDDLRHAVLAHVQRQIQITLGEGSLHRPHLAT
jgi:hypothetical protein